MSKGMFRTWVVVSIVWLAIIAIRAFHNWPVDITWDNGISSRVEAGVDTAMLALLPTLGLVIAAMSKWMMRGFRE